VTTQFQSKSLAGIVYRTQFSKPLSWMGIVATGLILAAPTVAQTPTDLQALETRTADSSPLTVAQAEADVIDIATTNGSFDTFLSLIEEVGMTEDLKGYGRFTAFIPTDEAFENLSPSVLETLSNDRALLAEVLSYHVVSGGNPLFAEDLQEVESLVTLASRTPIELKWQRGTLYVNQASVVEADIAAENGVIHAIDRVLVPPTVLDRL